jgi:hypothetical protein
MKGLFPRLEAIYDPDRKNDTRYGGAYMKTYLSLCLLPVKLLACAYPPTPRAT